MDDLLNFDEPLAKMTRTYPSDFLPIVINIFLTLQFEKAVQQVYQTHYFGQNAIDGDVPPLFQVQIHSDENPRMLRDLQSNIIG